MSGRAWEGYEDDAIRNRCGKEPISGIAKRLGRTESAVVKRAYRLGVSIAYKNLPWTTLEDRLMMQLVDDGVPYSVIATKMERSVRAVMQRRYERLRDAKQG